MTRTQDMSQELVDQVHQALDNGTALEIRGGGSKRFYGRPVDAAALDVGSHVGIVNYEPTELVLTARAGTPLGEIDRALAAEGQMMPFEPPDYTGSATLGGAFAAGLSGPRRPWAGSARDLILGVRLINGQGAHQRYGGEVMKNVAGYDVSRVVTGALGTLGVITEVSMKVLPLPEAELTLELEYDRTAAVLAVENWYRDGFPVTGSAFHNGCLRVRLAGSASAVEAASRAIGGTEASGGSDWWRDLNNQKLEFFTDGDTPLWRIALPPAATNLDLAGERLFDWNGQLRWLRSSESPSTVRERAQALGGHATLFRGGNPTDDVFHPLAPAVHTLNKRLKQAFDPKGIFNPGRIYAGI